MGGMKRAIMDEIGKSSSMWSSGITGDKSCALAVIFRLMTNICSSGENGEREQCGGKGGKGCVTGLVPENLPQPLPPELLRRLQKGHDSSLLASPPAKPST
ncbi:hypothetical protein NQZ68_022747 [Dissostichus eleginoides]|nr:hypothetical protein NQZ68_022747 [Dissostichus eleginoides]